MDRDSTLRRRPRLGRAPADRPGPDARIDDEPGRKNRSSLVGPLLFAGAFVTLAVLEEMRPLRVQTEPKLRRDLRNAAMAALSAIAITMLEKPLVRPLAEQVERRRWGLLKIWRLPPSVELPLAIALLDYTLYLWHVLAHRWPPLWRLHQPHHLDHDMDASTGVRFHFAEMAASAPWRAAQVALLGIGPRTLAIWQGFVLGCVLFHHSNLRLPRRAEGLLAKALVTPRLHGLHHSLDPAEQRTNFSGGFTFWDRLHGTLNLDLSRDHVDLGVASYRAPEAAKLPNLLAMPFRRSQGGAAD